MAEHDKSMRIVARSPAGRQDFSFMVSGLHCFELLLQPKILL